MMKPPSAHEARGREWFGSGKKLVDATIRDMGSDENGDAFWEFRRGFRQAQDFASALFQDLGKTEP